MSEGNLDRRSFLAGALALGAYAATPAARAAGTGASHRAAPKGFLWGTASAGHQVEGNNTNSDFWVMEHVKPTLFVEPSGDACDHYHRYEEDFALAQQLGFNCQRLSIEWSRIEPAEGEFSMAALDHYQRVLEACHKHGLAPMVTYNHFTTPAWFAARGGFERNDSAALFARYAEKATAKLGHLIHSATTFNEPNLLLSVFWRRDKLRLYPKVVPMAESAAKAVGSDRFVTFYTGREEVTRPNIILAHQKAYAAIKAGPGTFDVGLNLAISDEQGVGENSVVEIRKKETYSEWFAAAATADFVGVQTYSRNRTDAQGDVGPEAGVELTQMKYEFYPQALGAAIRLAAKQTGKPVIVTENGIGTDDDTRRIAYIDIALNEVSKCLADGIDVRGYIHWSFMDNFEWLHGYHPKFGLVACDRNTFKRSVKPSGYHLSKIAKANKL